METEDLVFLLFSSPSAIFFQASMAARENSSGNSIAEGLKEGYYSGNCCAILQSRKKNEPAGTKDAEELGSTKAEDRLVELLLPSF